MVEEVAWAAEGYEAGSNGADEEEAVMRRAVDNGEDKDGDRQRGGGRLRR